MALHCRCCFRWWWRWYKYSIHSETWLFLQNSLFSIHEFFYTRAVILWIFIGIPVASDVHFLSSFVDSSRYTQCLSSVFRSQCSGIQLKNGNDKTLTCQNLSAEFFFLLNVVCVLFLLHSSIQIIKNTLPLNCQFYHRSGVLISYGLYWFSISDVPAAVAVAVRVAVLWPNNFGMMARVCHVISFGIRDENKMLV